MGRTVELEIVVGMAQIKSPTVIPIQNFDPIQDAETLYKAVNGYFIRHKVIINILCRRTRDQRLKIVEEIKSRYNQDIRERFRRKLKGDFRNVVNALLTPLVPDFYTIELRYAIQGLGTCEATLIDILCTLSNEEVKKVKERYKTDYGKSLETDIKEDTSGIFCRLLLCLCLGERDESDITDPDAAETSARKLYECGVLRPGTDESIFIRVFCYRNFSQLRQIFKAYEAINGKHIEDAIKAEFSGDAKNMLLSIISYTRNPEAFYAKKLHQSMKGLGTNDRQLIRLITTLCELDMREIKKVYAEKYGESLAKAIKGDCSGHYKKALLTLIGEA